MWWWQDQNIYNVQNVKQKNYGNKNLFFSSLVFFKLEKKKKWKNVTASDHNKLIRTL